MTLNEFIENSSNEEYWEMYQEVMNEEQEYYPGFGYAEDIDILY